MQHNKSSFIAVPLVLSLLLGLGVAQHYLQDSVTAASNGRMVPHFEVDPFWPQPLPNKWILGSAIGVAVDARDHVYIVHRNDDSNFATQEIGIDNGIADCCTAAPPILEFDVDGSLVNAWGGPGQGYTWPASNHGIEIAPNGNVWIGGNGGGDSHVLVFTRDGQFVREIGLPGEDIDSNSTLHFNQVAEISIDPDTSEAYIADGYGNKRVAVVDVATGAFKRYWGAYGNRPSDDRVTYTPGEPISRTNWPSRVNTRTWESPPPLPPIQTLPLGAISMPWFEAGQVYPCPGPPHALTSEPSTSNSRIGGAAVQQSAIPLSIPISCVAKLESSFR
jgi:hypothetical protein